jgi:hypothetical protein
MIIRGIVWHLGAQLRDQSDQALLPASLISNRLKSNVPSSLPPGTIDV